MIACVNVPALPLQLLRHAHPDWVAFPMAVVDRDAPTGKVEWVNQRAWRERVRPGMRYAAALALTGELRAGCVDGPAIEAAVAALGAALQDHSPAVEASQEQPGVYWLAASGLERLYGTPDAWAREVEQTLEAEGYHATLVVGFDRFAVYALALARHTQRVMETPDAERRAMARVPLERLKLEPRMLAGLHKLGVRTLGQLLRLPRAKIAKRFGAPAERLYRQATEASLIPVQPHSAPVAIAAAVDFERPEFNVDRIVSWIQSRLPRMVGALLERDALLAALEVTLTLERRAGEKQGAVLRERIKPANPTLDEALILDLTRLRLEGTPLQIGVARIAIEAEPQQAQRSQPSLLQEKPRRDLDAANRALARVRAELGEDAVGVLLCADGHLPEARMRWQSLARLRPAAPVEKELRPLVRRLESPPIVLPPRPRNEPDGWLVRGPEDGPVVRSTGPHILSGGWWATEIHREYHYLETTKGMLLWVFFDRRRRRWYLQGRVE